MDKRSANLEPEGSKENPLCVPVPEAQVENKKWTVPISAELQNTNRVLETVSKMEPWLDMAHKLGEQVNSLLMAAAALTRNKKSPEKIAAVMNRVRPILALKEDIDIYISEQCEKILEKLENDEYSYDYVGYSKETSRT